MTKLYLFRHGEVENSALRVFNGHRDVALSKEGVRQFEVIAKKMENRNIDAVYSSDLKRAESGAALIASPHSLEPLSFSELRELNFGEWEGMELKEVLLRYPDEMNRRAENLSGHRIKSGESLLDLKERVIPCLKKMLLSHPDGAVACVAHGGVNRVILLWAMEVSFDKFYSFRQDYGGMNVVNFYEGGHVELERMNVCLFHPSIHCKELYGKDF